MPPTIKDKPPVKEATEKSDDVRARVVSVNSETGKPNSRMVHFEGLEDDARLFLVNNFPRPHVAGSGKPVPDVVLQTMKGDKVQSTQQFHATDGWSDYKEDGDEE